MILQYKSGYQLSVFYNTRDQTHGVWLSADPPEAKVKRQIGFSLIEMLVVLFIAALGFSVVAPGFIKTYDKISIGRETQKMSDLINSLKTKAFVRKKDYKIELDDHSLLILKEDINIFFKYIRFEKSEFTINANGFANKAEFKYYAGSKKEVLIQKLSQCKRVFPD